MMVKAELSYDWQNVEGMPQHAHTAPQQKLKDLLFHSFKEISKQALSDHQTEQRSHNKEYKLHAINSEKSLNKNSNKLEKGRTDFQSCHITLFEVSSFQQIIMQHRNEKALSMYRE